MVSALRPIVSFMLLVGGLWFVFSVKLGNRTFAEHIDRIGQTPEANELIEGTRATLNPVVEEATARMLGEHIEAPTYVDPIRPNDHEDEGDKGDEGDAPSPRASSAHRTKLPGHRP